MNNKFSFTFSPRAAAATLEAPVSTTINKSTLHTAISNFDYASLVKILLHEVSQIQFKKKREATGFSDDHQVLERMLKDMMEMLNYKFLNVNLKESAVRPVQANDWSTLTACRRSEAGTTGIYFVQCEESVKSGSAPCTSIVVAKPIQAEEFEKHRWVNEMTGDFFKIRCPGIRIVEKQTPEYNELEASVKALFSNLQAHQDMYECGGKSSPKDLFSTTAIMLMELVRGNPLCHRLSGQRELVAADYRAVGRLFLLDLLIRNTDRLPCRKAMPRPGSTAIADQGNAGNLMFGEAPGSLWAIDPEMKTKLTPAMEATYVAAFHSVVNEIVHEHATSSHFKVISDLFFNRIPYLEGVLDASLNDLSPWDSKTELQRRAIDSVLELIRIRANAFDRYIIQQSSGDFEPPSSSDEKDWREWIRLTIPRAIPDIVEFIEAHTGYAAPPSAAAHIEAGFLESLAAARKMRRDIVNPFSLVGKHFQFVKMSIAMTQEEGLPFIIRLINSLEKYDGFVPELPQSFCDEDGTSVAAKHFSEGKKKLRSAVHKIVVNKRKSGSGKSHANPQEEGQATTVPPPPLAATATATATATAAPAAPQTQLTAVSPTKVNHSLSIAIDKPSTLPESEPASPDHPTTAAVASASPDTTARPTPRVIVLSRHASSRHFHRTDSTAAPFPISK